MEQDGPVLDVAEEAAGPDAPRLLGSNNEARILDAAEEVFATYGFRGATTAMIAAKAGVTKPNIYYYFRSKEALYRTLLRGIISQWADTLRIIEADKEPEDCLRLYLQKKMEFSRAKPQLSRIFANEIISGAPYIGDQIAKSTRPLLEEKSDVIRRWQAEGKLDPAIDPTFLIFLMWSSTQAYADFAVQIEILLGKKRLDKADYAAALDTISSVVLAGVLKR